MEQPVATVAKKHELGVFARIKRGKDFYFERR
jgi:hypothetical protein